MMGEKVKIQEIKAAYQALNPDDEPMLQQFIHTYAVDERSGVQALVEQTKKKLFASSVLSMMHYSKYWQKTPK